MYELVPDQAVIHNHGATFAFKPVGNASTQILISKVVREDGSVRYIRDQEIGPFGNAALEPALVDNMNHEWRALAVSMAKEAHQLIAFLEGFNPGYWEAPIEVAGDPVSVLQDAPAEVRPPDKTPKKKGGKNEKANLTKTNDSAGG